MNDVLWTSVAPLWSEQSGSDLSDLGQPTILRFANDSFMDEFANILANQPARLADYRAWPETWREPLPQPASVAALPPALREFQRKRLGQAPVLGLADHSDPTKPLKLYQPAHQRYYLLTASLVCRQIGLPDRALNTSAQEKASFVIRRLMLAHPESFAGILPPAPDQAQPGVYEEFAFVSGEWQKVLDGKLLADGEELNPLFAVCYTQGDDRRRRLFGGLIPVGKREAYMTAKKAAPAAVVPDGVDPRLDMLLRRDFFIPWQRLIESAIVDMERMCSDINNADSADRSKVKDKQVKEIVQKRRQIQEASWYLLLDLSNFLDRHMNPLPAAVLGALNSITMPVAMQAAIHQAVDTYHLPGSTNTATLLGDALNKIQTYKKAVAPAPSYLETTNEPYKGSEDEHKEKWPAFLFPLVDLEMKNDGGTWKPVLNFPYKSSISAAELGVLGDPKTRFDEVRALLNELRATLLAALPTKSALRMPPVPLAAQISKTMESMPITETGWFVARCALERPNCFPLPNAVVSDPTQAFQLAGFFDPDAPARPIRIALPVDTSSAGLRKFDKNTAFIMSDILCGQVSRAKNMGLIDLICAVLPWPLHKDLGMDTAPCSEDGVAFGMICSLSIPIITICALILLMIIVNLLDIIFHWIPYFILCFPLPKFSAKKASP